MQIFHQDFYREIIPFKIHYIITVVWQNSGRKHIYSASAIFISFLISLEMIKKLKTLMKLSIYRIFIFLNFSLSM